VSAAESKSKQSLPGAYPNGMAWKIAAGIGVLGVAAAFGASRGDPAMSERFAYSYLFGYMFFLTIGLGALGFVLIQHLVGAGWSVTVRRVAECFMSALPVFVVLFIPLALSLDHLYPWLHPHEGGHGGHGAQHEGAEHHEAQPLRHRRRLETHPSATPTGAQLPGSTFENGLGNVGGFSQREQEPTNAHETKQGPEEGNPHAEHAGQAEHHANAETDYGAHWERITREESAGPHAIHARVLASKKPFLNGTFFWIRAGLYFVIWTLLSLRFFSWSTGQDKSKDPKISVSAQRMAAPSLFLFALTLTFAAFDWVMSLDPVWYSTIYGVWVFSGSIVTTFAVLSLVTLWLRSKGLLGDTVNVEHYHDLGKLMFGFNVFWAYISFSQFFLIWYASIPEETRFFHFRWAEGPWKPISLFLLAGHFIVPFFLLLSRNTKRFLPSLAIGAGMLVCMHIVDIYWMVMPNYNPGKAGDDVARSFSPHWLDVASLVGVGGVFLAWVFYQMHKHPLVPVGDPRLKRSLEFENA